MYSFVLTVIVVSMFYNLYFLLRLFFDDKQITVRYLIAFLITATLSMWGYILIH